MQRIYDVTVQNHITYDDEMLFLCGPRQVGKTTICQHAEKLSHRFLYLNWDNEDQRTQIMQGPANIIQALGGASLSETKPIIVFDEIHKRPDWKNFIKGFYDSYGKQNHIIVTGSAKLDIYKQGGDSLMGRYFLYRVHPLSVAECLRTSNRTTVITQPKEIDDNTFHTLLQYGGFPKPFLKRDKQFSHRWQNLRKQQLIQEDIRDCNLIQDLNKLKLLMDFLKQQAAGQLTYSNLAKHIRVSVDTITRWIDVLESFYYCYRITPWSKNIARALVKEPKLFLWDWSLISDLGAKAENFVASHLLKATQYWHDCGLGNYGLHYIRTTDKKEIDFVITKDDAAWCLVEVKLSNTKSISPHLAEFQNKTGAEHAFQVVLNAPYVDKDCFSCHTPIIVPAKTFLSQLI